MCLGVWGLGFWGFGFRVGGGNRANHDCNQLQIVCMGISHNGKPIIGKTEFRILTTLNE